MKGVTDVHRTVRPGHSLKSLLCHSKDVRIHIGHILPAVRTYRVIVIDGELLIWINCNKNNPYRKQFKTTVIESHKLITGKLTAPD